ncbi:bifunctional diguanylate cyclase/phosphodiesterase [Halopseudomonas oceani]|uniref:cyclic-guanylate-specific phosphodiesterase n=1 Tax=Halopseudomonas oceani TaxID=1708783 RepID=A0A2P4ER92_9GAMM|nr:bifunctional diguanylate cyclase/phosphodiesterase [Halopseudomonas oceani]POB01124.1 bifunctional diguanylate cyclase/phosphodiesterase [Halopseudomonas oceani]GGE57403.1 bifunctional diguanylate cyclase/phosphodiesterase [Halopseudomonas oceani]
MNSAAKGCIVSLVAIAGAGCSASEFSLSSQLHITQVGVLLLSCILLLAAHGLNQLRRRAIAQRQEALELLGQQEHRYRTLVEKLHVVTWEMSYPSLRFVYASPHAEDLLGFPASDWLQPDFLANHLHPEDHRRVLSSLREYALAKQQQSFDFRLCRQSGDCVWVRAIINRVSSEEYEAASLHGLLIDIQEQKLAEQALRSSEQKFASVFHNCPDTIVLAEANEGRFLSVNRTFEEQFGITMADAVGHTATELGIWVNPGTGPGLLSLLLTKTKNNIELEFRRADGSRFTGLLSARSVSIDNQPVLVTVLRDISALKHTQEQLRLSEQKFSRAFHASPDGLLISRASDGMLLDVNEGFTRITGYTREQAIGTSTLALRIWRDDDDRKRMVETLRREGRVRDMLSQVTTTTGSVRQVEICTEAITINNQECMLSIARDVTERLEMENSLRQAATVFENTNEGVIITDSESRIAAVNRAFSRITGIPAHEAVGQPIERLATYAEDQNIVAQAWEAIKTHGQWQGESWSRRANGELYAAWSNVSQVLNVDGSLSHLVAVFSDITPLKHTQARLDHQAHHDPLTGLPNRILFEARLREALNSLAMNKTDQLGALLFIDLDRFKQINDSLGHPVGDSLLQLVSQRLCSVLREIDTVARHGGDEFIVLLPNLHTDVDAAAIADKLLGVFRTPFLCAGHEFFVSASIGISLFPTDADDVNSLIKHADAAMYQAKNQGRNRYAFYTSDLTVNAHQRLEMENDMRRGLERGEFILYYQPKVMCDGGKLNGAEALVRWNHPQQGLIEPDRFIPLAEDTGLIVDLGRSILHSACAQLAEWRDQGFLLPRVAINVSGTQLIGNQLVSDIRLALTEHGLTASQLELEITEDFVMNQNREAITLLDLFKSMGIHLSIDDFGTGYSSLAYLKELPLDTLKIDRSFVAGLPGNHHDAAISQTIIVLAHNLGMNVIAEGVETTAQRDILQAQGCDSIQGYLISPPLSASAFATTFLSRAPSHQPSQSV